MRIFLVILIVLQLSICTNAREYNSMRDYKSLTGNTELNKRDWLKKHRKNTTTEWLQACAFNFSYATGHTEYRDSDERGDFFLWVQNEFLKRGHEVYWPAMAAEISHRTAMIYKKENEIGQFARMASNAVFETMFLKLQEFAKQPEILKGQEALLWDKAMIRFEQEVLIQPIYMRMSPKTLKKLNNIAGRKNFYFLKVPASLKFQGDLKNVEDRVNYGENVLLPYVKGEPIVREEKQNAEPAKITAEKEEKGERNETSMEKNLVEDFKKETKKDLKQQKKDAKNIKKWNKRELKLDGRAIEKSAIDPNAY